MKRIKKLAVVLAAVTALVLLPEANAFTSKAEEPVTYSIKYVSDELGWRFQTSPFTGNDKGQEMHYFYERAKDGDLVVVYNDIGTNKALDLRDLNLSNLTYMSTKSTVVYAGSVTDCFVLAGTYGTVNCDVTNAYVYDAVTFQFNNNVTNLYVYAKEKITSNLIVAGTVGHLLATTPDDYQPYRQYANYYNFSAGALRFTGDGFNPRGSYFTFEQISDQQSATEEGAALDDDDEYDDVPQTGQDYLYLWFLGASAVCFAGSIALKRKTIR